MTSEKLVTQDVPAARESAPETAHPTHTHHAGAEHLTLALVSLLPKHAPVQNKILI